MTTQLASWLLVAATVLGVGTAWLHAGEGCCARCGCQAPCEKVCRLVCEEKSIQVACFGCKCEDFCLPGYSQPGCKHCDVVCDDDACDPGAPCTQAKSFAWREWIPGCATIHTKKKLMKKSVTKKIPSHKWVVEDLCPHCQAVQAK